MKHGPALWRSTPPAIFPAALGFIGLGLALVNAAQVTPIPREFGDVVLGGALMFFVFFTVLYLMKALSRPGVVIEDLKTPPARAGLSAMPMALILVAAVMNNFGLALPWLMFTGIALHIVLALIVLRLLWRDAPETRSFSPFQYLTFVGLIVVPAAALPMGYISLTFWLAIISLVAFLGITAGYIPKFIRNRPPQPLRPSLVITIAPLSLFGIYMAQIGKMEIFWGFYILAWIATLACLLAARWIMQGGWTPVWGALTFPLTAFVNLQVMAYHVGSKPLALIGIYAGLAVAVPLISYVIFKHAMAWTSGQLSAKSGAAVA